MSQIADFYLLILYNLEELIDLFDSIFEISINFEVFVEDNLGLLIEDFPHSL